MVDADEELAILREAAKSWVGRNAPVGKLRALRDSGAIDGVDRDIWRGMAEMGWFGTIIPEEYGGSDLGYGGIGIILEETGRALVPSPVFATGLISAAFLVAGGSEAQKQTWLPKIAEGAISGTLAIDEGPRHAPASIGLRATRTSRGWSLSGTKTFVIDGGIADLIIVAARTSGGLQDVGGVTLFLVPGTTAGIGRQALQVIDSRGAANLTFDQVVAPDADVVGQVDAGRALLDAVLDRARIGLAAEMLGSAGQAFELIVDYLKTRVQFGKPIGSFQALQHRAARMFTELELARSCVAAGLQAIDSGTDDVSLLASLAKTRAGSASHLISNEIIQLHGGIGMTDAHDAGLYLKRARITAALFGSAAFHRDRYALLRGF